MDNKQLMEVAAKAAGYEVNVESHGIYKVIDEPRGVYSILWNPIESDEDAFRLMVDCTLMVLVFDHRVIVEDTSPLIKEQYADHNNDKRAATRMAIVKAAARSA